MPHIVNTADQWARYNYRLTLDTDHVYQMYTQLYTNDISQLKACMLLFTLSHVQIILSAVYEYHVYFAHLPFEVNKIPYILKFMEIYLN